MRTLAGAAIAVAGILVSCALGPTLRQEEASLSPIPAGKARLFIYRPEQFWTSVAQPRVLVGDAHIGDAVPGGVRILDLSPGQHCVTMEFSPLYQKSGSPARCVDLHEGRTAYVRAAIAGRQMRHYQHYQEEFRRDDDKRGYWRKVRTYQSGFAPGQCRSLTGYLCEERIVTTYYNDLTIMDATTGRSETLDLVLLEKLPAQ